MFEVRGIIAKRSEERTTTEQRTEKKFKKVEKRC